MIDENIEEIRRQLAELQSEHRDLDDVIDRLRARVETSIKMPCICWLLKVAPWWPAALTRSRSRTA